MRDKPRALLFDWDNTLVDSWAVIHAALATTFTHMGMTPWTLEESRQRVRASARDAFPKIFGDRADEASRIFYQTYDAIHLEQLRPLPDAENLLNSLVQAGFYLAVVSNKRGSTLRTEAAHLGWDRYFQRLVGAQDALQDKPSPAPVHLALEGSGVAPGAGVWFIGDTDIDLDCARNASCVPILLRSQAQTPEELLSLRPQLHFFSCAELAEHLVP